jgi:serine/threonine protein kinase
MQVGKPDTGNWYCIHIDHHVRFRNTTYKALKVCTTGWTRHIDDCREMQVLEALRKKKESNRSYEERNIQSSYSDVAPDGRATGDRIESWRYEVLRETLAAAAPPSKTRRRMSLPISIDNATYTFHKTALAVEKCLESRNAPANTPIQHGIGPTADGTSSTHPGRHHVLDYLGTFKENRHQVIVSKPLAFSLDTLLKTHRRDSRPFSMSFVRKVTRQILQGIDFMHSELNMLYAGMRVDIDLLAEADTIVTGVKPRNVVLTFPDIDRMISHELERLPSSCNINAGRPLEQSLGLSSYLQDPSILDEASFVLVDYGRCV